MNNPKISWLHSKTSFIRGVQCVKSMYLHRHNRELKTQATKNQNKISNKGNSFENQFQRTNFPNGRDLKQELGKDLHQYTIATNKLLEEQKECSIFDAGLIANNILILIDVLHKTSDDTIEIYEVKNSSKMKSVFIWDAALQYHVCKEFFGEKLKSFNLVLKGRNNTFKIIEVSKQAEKKQEQIKVYINNFTKILQAPIAPVIDMGKHCNIPYECDFKEYCKNSIK